MLPNPYRPGAGMSPAYLAGRDETIKYAKNALETVNYGYPVRSIVYYGLRGVGKTVLLNYIENIAEEMNIPNEYMEITERDKSFQTQLALHIYKLINKLSMIRNIENQVKKALSILKAFTIKYSIEDISIEINPASGISDTGILSNDMTELFMALGSIAQKQNKGCVIFIDEIQYLKEAELEALMEAIHRVNQKSYPIVIFVAGLPKIAKIVGDIKPYAERLFDFIEISALNKKEV